MSGWHRRARISRDAGITLPEVLLVVVVLGLLAGLVAFTTRRITERAAGVTCLADQRTIQESVAAWTAINGPDRVSMDALVGSGLLRAPSDAFVIIDGDVTPIPGGPCERDGDNIDLAGATVTRSAGPDDAPREAGSDDDTSVGGSTVGGSSSSPAGGATEAGGMSPSSDDRPRSSDSLEIALTWTGNADADIWVVSPDGEVLGWTSPTASGGRLDLDSIPVAPDDVGPHVERVVWPAGAAPAGQYTVFARFETPGWGPQDGEGFTVTVRSGDEVLLSERGDIGAEGSSSEPLTVEVLA